jgi:hypothetical protein
MMLLKEYRVSERRLMAVKEQERPWAAMERTWDTYADCSATQRRTLLKRLTSGQRAFMALNGLEAEVNNGGIHQFFWNSTGDLAGEVLAGLKLIGAHRHLRLFQKAIELFREPAILRSRRCRQKVLREISIKEIGTLFDEPFFALERRKDTQLASFRQVYLENHREEFVLPQGQEEERPQRLASRKEYRVRRGKADKLSGEKLQWALVKNLWELYCQALNGGVKDFHAFLPSLSKGQRAVAALLLLKNNLKMTGLHGFFGCQAGADILVPETKMALTLVSPKAHGEAFDAAVKIAGNLPDLNRLVEEQSRLVARAEEAADATAIAAARKSFRHAYDIREERSEDIYESLELANDRFETLVTSGKPSLDDHIEAYVRAHPGEFLV